MRRSEKRRSEKRGSKALGLRSAGGLAPPDEKEVGANEMYPMGMDEWAAKGENMWCALLPH